MHRFYIYIREYYLPTKKKEIMPFKTTWMDFEGIMLNEISQTEKDKYSIVSLTCGIQKKKRANSEVENQKVGSHGLGSSRNRKRLVKSTQFPW